MKKKWKILKLRAGVYDKLLDDSFHFVIFNLMSFDMI